MKRFSVGIIVVLFLGIVFVVGAQNTIKPPVEVTATLESKPNLRVPTLKQIPSVVPQPESEVELQIPTLEKLSTITSSPEQRPNLVMPSLEQVPLLTWQGEFKPELRIPSLEKPPGVSSLPEQRPTLTVPQLQRISSFAPQPEQRPTLTIPQLQGISPFTPQTEFIPEPQLFVLRELPSVQGLRDTEFGYFKLSDFSGGLNKQGFPTEIADNEVTELVNFVWEGKKLVPRDGFTTYYDMSEFAAGYRIWGLYRYSQQDESKILLAGVNATLYADTNTSGSFVSVKTGLQSNDKYYYFDTFKDKCIVAHEGDYPFWYDGDSVQNLGLIANAGVIDVKSSTACLSDGIRRTEAWFTIPKMADVQEDQFVSYTIGLTCTGVVGGWIYEFVTKFKLGVAGDTVFTPSFGVCWPDTDKTFKLLANFSFDEAVDSGTIDSVTFYSPTPTDCGHYFKVYDASKSWSTDQYARYVVEVKEDQRYQGHARYIQANGNTYFYIGFYDGDSLAVNRPFQEGVDYRIRKLDFYEARLVRIYKSRIFLVAREQDPALKERIVFSKFNNLNDFPLDNYIPLNFKQSEHVTALATFYEDQLGYKDQSKDCLVIFTNNSIYKLIFNSATDYYLVQVVEGVGCVAPKTIVNVEGKYLLFLHTAGVYAFDGRTVTLVSSKIDPIIKHFESGVFNLAVGAYYDRYYYLNYPDLGHSFNRHTLVFNVDLGIWGQADNIHTSLFCQQNALSDTCKLLFAHISKSLIYRFGITETDTGQPISLTLKSKAFNLGDLHKSKRFTYFDFDYYLDSDSVKAWFYTDFGDSLRYSAYANESGGNRHVRIPLDADCLGRNFSFKLTANSLFELGSVAFKFREIGE